MSARGATQIRGAHVLAAMLCFFAAVIAINVAFAVAAVRSFPGEDVRRSYLQGLNFNDTLAQRRAQAAIGWSVRSELIETRQGPAVHLRLRDAEGRAIRDASVEGALRWPTDARLDRSLAFEPRGDGVYVARLAQLRAGRWIMRARASNAAGGSLDFEAELTWPSTQ
jgi:nitrogen fixation protein FixH